MGVFEGLVLGADILPDPLFRISRTSTALKDSGDYAPPRLLAGLQCIAHSAVAQSSYHGRFHQLPQLQAASADNLFI